ncbi:MAG: pimeloyl-ACP methyl ester carboxylesterase [Ilumatobacter sp.]|jgi:pimeloyl-ACP methyl ester carboxylesterase
MSLTRLFVQLWSQAPSKRDLLRSIALDTKGGNRAVTSSDGTSLSVRVSGSGPPVVLVHGALDGMNAFAFVEPPLANGYTVWTYDRRGRGESTNASDYSLDREVEDLQAILEATGETAHVIAHSFGAVIALQAALAGAEMRSLAAYEPPVNGNEIAVGLITEINGYVHEGRLDEAIATMARDFAQFTAKEVADAMAIPLLRKRLRDGARTAPRELQAIRSADWSGLPVEGVPTLVIRGELTDAAVYPSTEQVDELATDSQVATLAGQGHVGQALAPAAFTDIIRPFLDAN